MRSVMDLERQRNTMSPSTCRTHLSPRGESRDSVAEAMIAQFAQAQQIVSEGLGLTPLDDLNGWRYSDDRMRRFHVPVAITRRGVVEILARDAKSDVDPKTWTA
jgi:hypothetical protein